MSLACGRFAEFLERCAPNGFLRERADPGPRRRSSCARFVQARGPRQAVSRGGPLWSRPPASGGKAIRSESGSGLL